MVNLDFGRFQLYIGECDTRREGLVKLHVNGLRNFTLQDAHFPNEKPRF